MIFRVLADTVVFLHFVWILFLLFGFVLGKRWKKIKFLHIAGLFFAFFIQTFDLYCPLTYVETFLRQRHDPETTYSGSFIPHYIEKLIYFEVSRSLILVATFIVVGLNLLFYLRVKKRVVGW